jgi:hypothetical protein
MAGAPPRGRCGPRRSDRVTDVVIEGVSLMQTKRDEISAVLARSGGQVGGMIAQIRDRTGQAATNR